MHLSLRRLPRLGYEGVWQMMRRFTDARTPQQVDEIWALEHHPVYTLGQAASLSHLLEPSPIPVLQTDRGGQITYHGPGQLMLYFLCHLPRLKMSIRALVNTIEQASIDCLDQLGIKAHRLDGAPGVYVANAKIVALGLRVRRACSYHGLCFNRANDLTPFKRINPCGYTKLPVTSLAQLGLAITDAELLNHWLKAWLALTPYDGLQDLGPNF